MVVKIQQSSGSMKGVIDYNERKVENGEACVVDYFGIQAPDRQSIEAEFQRLERLNIRTQNVSFHMSINPGPRDDMSEEEIKEFASRLFSELGYGSQPYVIYRHEDIDRVHYHLVSIRVQDNGRKIRDRQEQNRCQHIMRLLQQEYSFIIGNEEVRGETVTPAPHPLPDVEGSEQLNPDEIVLDENEEGSLGEYPQSDDDPSEQEVPVEPIFLEGESEVIAHMNAAFDHALEYHFTTWPQFQWIMQAHGIEVDIAGTDDNRMFTFQGIDQDGIPCSSIISERELGRPCHELFSARLRQCPNEDTRRERNRAANAIRMCVQNASNEEDLKRLLADKGYDLHLSRGRDGVLFGTTIIDHRNKCAFKGSELGRDISMLIKGCVQGEQSPVPSDEGESQGRGHGQNQGNGSGEGQGNSQENGQGHGNDGGGEGQGHGNGTDGGEGHTGSGHDSGPGQDTGSVTGREQETSSQGVSTALLIALDVLQAASRTSRKTGKDPKKKKKKKRRRR